MRLKSFTLALVLAVLSAASAGAAAMTFRPMDVGDCRSSCQKVLLAEGEIGTNSDVAFQRALSKAGGRRTVLLDSPGGNILGSLKLGFAFREAKMAVGVAPGGTCYSACVYALFGGVERSVPDDARVGIHGFADLRANVSPRDMSFDKDIYGLLRQYAKEMGVSPAVIAMAEKTRNDDLRILSPGELRRMRVVTR